MNDSQLSPASPQPVAISRDVDLTAGWMTAQQVLGQLSVIQQVMTLAMKDGEHYGKIPGCGDKPTLLKPGAEKLCLTFRLAPKYIVVENNFEKGHREYRVQCSLMGILTNSFVGEGVGICSTMEAKYRYRGKSGRTCPECGKQAIIKGKAEYGGGWVCFKKKDGCGAKFKDGDRAIEDQSDERQENPDLADTYNTVLKMAKKRALVDAVLTATAASDIFTQDLEEIAAHLTNETTIVQREERRERFASNVAPIRRVNNEAEAVDDDPHSQMRNWMDEAKISEGDFTLFLRQAKKPSGAPFLREHQQLSQLTFGQVNVILDSWAKLEANYIYWRKPKGGQASVPAPKLEATEAGSEAKPFCSPSADDPDLAWE